MFRVQFTVQKILALTTVLGTGGWRAKLQWSIAGLWGIATGLYPAVGLSQTASCAFAPETDFNIFQVDPSDTNEDGVIVIGRLIEKPYVVIIPGQDTALLDQVRQCVPTAFTTQSKLGDYVYVAAFEDLEQANSLVWLLRSRDFDARVVYQR